MAPSHLGIPATRSRQSPAVRLDAGVGAELPPGSGEGERGWTVAGWVCLVTSCRWEAGGEGRGEEFVDTTGEGEGEKERGVEKTRRVDRQPSTVGIDGST